jgi:hypothetical protein
VPDDVHAVLRRRGAAAEQSLQEYLRAELIAQARQPTVEEVFDRISQRTGGSLSLEEAVEAVREDRDHG